MAADWEGYLERWHSAALVDAETVQRIREFEGSQAPSRRLRWPIVLALAFGALLLGAGVLLFVSAHWDELSPLQRMLLVVLMVVVFHVGGAFTRKHFEGLGMALHAVGSMTLGAGIALAGQIFNMQEHWPAAILMWALGAIAGWVLLGHWSQAALAALLIPAWLAGEWVLASDDLRANYPFPVTQGLCMLAFAYLTVDSPGDSSPLRRALRWIGGFCLLPSVVPVVVYPWFRETWKSPGMPLVILAWIIALGLPLAVAVLFRRRAALLNLGAAAWVLAAGGVAQARADVLIYAWCALGCVGLIAWGVYESRTERINLGIAGFAITLLVFYFSSVMDKLGRSASLIGLGVLFLAGGWALEKARRRLVARARPEGA
jgi:uncharacterized membrane protein